jgi:hypothetical protein
MPARLLLYLWVLLAAAPVLAQALETPKDIAAGLAALGPRSDREARRQAAGLLVEALRRAGLQRVRTVPVPGSEGLVNVEGVLPGKTADEIVLSAHYDSVPGSPGAGDDASGCGVAIAAAADLRRTPLSHTVRVVLFDGEETGLDGSEGWLRGRQREERQRVLANLNLEMLGWKGSAGPVILTFPAGRLELAPGWLVHSVLRGGEAVGWPFEAADNRSPFLVQLIVRSVKVGYGSDSESFLEMGIPSVTLSDSSLLVLDPAYHQPADTAGRLDGERLDRWTQTVAAVVRRLDSLAGRPLPEDQYLVFAGRVWLRRDLIWIGFLLWGVLVFRGRPGRWRGTSTAEHGRQMRSYLPGFLFRLFLLAAIFLAPVFAVLLFPAAALALLRPRPVWARVLWVLLGFLPFFAYLAVLGVALAQEAVFLDAGFKGGMAAAVLIPATLVAYGITVASRPRQLTADDASGKVES